jgi:hypothetical protein
MDLLVYALAYFSIGALIIFIIGWMDRGCPYDPLFKGDDDALPVLIFVLWQIVVPISLLVILVGGTEKLVTRIYNLGRNERAR